MQIALPTIDFNPLPARSAHYVPVLQMRAGELDAISHLPAVAWRRTTPLIVIPRGSNDQGGVTDTTLRNWTKTIVDTLGDQQPFYVSLLRLAPDAPVGGVSPSSIVLDRLHDRLRRRAACFLPVYDERWESQAAIDSVRDANDSDGRGFALRVRLDDALPATGQTIEHRASVALNQIGQADTCDLMIDFGYLRPDREPDIEGICDQFNELDKIGNWRNRICLSTTMPAAMDKGLVAPGSVGQLPRHERTIIGALREAHPQIEIVYGDYAIQHPEPAKGGPGMYPNIRYTTSDRTIVIRGSTQVIQGGTDEYPEMCKRLMNLQAFRGSTYTWGDAVIAACATGDLAPGQSPMWRAAGTSHHLREVLGEIATEATKI